MPPCKFSCVVLCAVFGFIVGMHTGWGCGAMAYAVAFLLAAFMGITFPRIAWHAFSLAILYSIGVAYVNSHELGECASLRWPRNITLTIQPETVNGKISENVAHGYARILEAPRRHGKIVGHRIYFIVECGEVIPARGQNLQIFARVEYIGSEKTKPFLKFLRKNHVFLYASNGKIEKYLSEKSRFDQMCERYRGKFFHALESGFASGESAGIITAMLTGSKHGLSREQRNDFSSTGTAHVFAISGFHVGVIALFFDWFFRLMKLSRRVRALPVIAILFIYLSIIGPTPSSMRAYATLFFYYAAVIFGRRSNVLSSFANGAAVNIFCAPESVFNVSFLLSYGIVFGIICIGSNLGRLIRNLKWRDRCQHAHTFVERIRWRIYSSVLDNFCVAFAASAVSIPMSVEFFGNFSCLTIPLNLILVPLASAVILIGGASLLLGAFNAFALCALVNKLAIVPISLMNFAMHCSRKLGHGLVSIPCPFEGIWMPALVLAALIGWSLAKVGGKNKYPPGDLATPCVL